MKMIGKIFIACGIAGVVLLFGFLLNRVDSLQQSVNYLNNNVFDLSTKMSNVGVKQQEIEVKQEKIMDQQQKNVDIINKLNLRCPWQSALHNPNLVNKYNVSVDIIEKNSSAELAGEYEGYYIDMSNNKWTHEYNTERLIFPQEAIDYLRTLKPLCWDSTYLIGVSIYNNSTESNVSEYQQSVFEYPQDAINYLEFINFCGQTEKDWEMFRGIKGGK